MFLCSCFSYLIVTDSGYIKANTYLIKKKNQKLYKIHTGIFIAMIFMAIAW